MATRSKIYSAPCNCCCRETHHKVLKEQKVSDEDEQSGHSWDTTHRMIECQGCHFISLQRIVTSTAYDEVEIEYFPPPVSRRKPDWANDVFSSVPKEMDDLLNEVYAALHANSRRLSAMGARALLDMTMTDKIKDVGRFDQKLDALENEGYIAKKQRVTLEAALAAGNAASHRGHCPTMRDLNHVMDIVESVISQIYIHPESAKKLGKSTPKRSQG